MSGFLYFVETDIDPTQVTGQQIAKWQLSHAFPHDLPTIVPLQAMHSPRDAGSGLLMADSARMNNHQIACNNRLQTWEKGRGIWAGYWSEAKPTSMSLRRAQMVNGRGVEFAGDVWLIPLIRQWVDADQFETCLPRFRVLDGDQWIDGDVAEKHRYLFTFMQQYFDEWHKYASKILDEWDGKDETSLLPFDMETEHPEDKAVTVLQCNYVIGPLEASVLRLFERQSRSVPNIINLPPLNFASDVLFWAADLLTAWKWMVAKKKDSSTFCEQESDTLRTAVGD